MDIFNFKKPKFKSDRETISALVEISAFSGNNEDKHKKSNMDKVLSEVESYIDDEVKNAKLAFWLGIAWRNYTSWHIRGNERKPFLEKATKYLEQAFRLAKDQLPACLPVEKRDIIEDLDQVTIAGDLGFMLVKEAIIRDLDKAERILTFVAENTQDYEPCLCPYAELYYKRGDYKKAAEIALDAHERIKHSTEWKNCIPPAPLGIAAMAYRALGGGAKKRDEIKEAIKWYQKIVELGIATENDQKILRKLKQMV